jgi:hypothetical protein
VNYSQLIDGIDWLDRLKVLCLQESHGSTGVFLQNGFAIHLSFEA